MHMADFVLLEGGDWFVLGIALLEIGAFVSYTFVQHDWRQGCVWLGVGLSNIAYLSMMRG